MANGFYTDYAAYLERFFPGMKVQKISVNTGFGCPNRDGTLGTGGCIYCNNTSFTPSYCFNNTSVSSQIEAGIRFFSRKYRDMRYLAYFQSFTGTYKSKAEELRSLYEIALNHPHVVGLVVGTRPDCLEDEKVKMLEELNQKWPVFVELGVESMHDNTLRLINRGHDSKTTENAVANLVKAGLHVGAHLIAGLPGEDESMMLESVAKVCELGIETLKLHQLQVLRDTPLYDMTTKGIIKINPWKLEDYLNFCVKVIDKVPRSIAIERFLASAPPQLVVTPKWGIKNYEFTNLLINKLNKR